MQKYPQPKKNSLRMYKTCLKKKKFSTQYKANEHIMKQSKPQHWQTYECPYCSSWHIAHAESARTRESEQ